MIVLAGLLALTGCVPWPIATAVVGTNVGSVATIQRTPADAVYSLLTGRDCSLVRLDQGKTYCRPVEPLPEAVLHSQSGNGKLLERSGESAGPSARGCRRANRINGGTGGGSGAEMAVGNTSNRKIEVCGECRYRDDAP
jgi:hypothetical protein